MSVPPTEVASPPPGFFKPNFDGAMKGTLSSSLDFFIRDDKDDLLMAGEKSLHLGASILLTEVSALIEGIKSAIAIVCRNFIIEGDNLVVINSINQL